MPLLLFHHRHNRVANRFQHRIGLEWLDDKAADPARERLLQGLRIEAASQHKNEGLGIIGANLLDDVVAIFDLLEGDADQLGQVLLQQRISLRELNF